MECRYRYNCLEAKKKIVDYDLDKYWTFTQADDRELGKKWTQKVDHIFIDTMHTYSHTLQELQLFEPFLNKNGIISFHDTRMFPEVLRAIKDFVREKPGKFRFYNYINCMGLSILKKM